MTMNYFVCKVGQSVLIGMKLELDLLNVYTKFQIGISKHAQKSQENVLLAGGSINFRFRVFLSAKGPKFAQPWLKSVGLKTLTI